MALQRSELSPLNFLAGAQMINHSSLGQLAGVPAAPRATWSALAQCVARLTTSWLLALCVVISLSSTVLGQQEEITDRIREAWTAGNADELITACKQYFEKIHPADPYIAYYLAGAYARKNDRDNAFTWLNQAVAWGYGKYVGDDQVVEIDPALANLRSDARYPPFLALIKKSAVTRRVVSEADLKAAQMAEAAYQARVEAKKAALQAPAAKAGGISAKYDALNAQNLSPDDIERRRLMSGVSKVSEASVYDAALEAEARTKARLSDPDGEALDARFADDGVREENFPFSTDERDQMHEAGRRRRIQQGLETEGPLDMIAEPAHAMGVTNHSTAVIMGLIPVLLICWWLYSRVQNRRRWDQLLHTWKGSQKDRFEYLRSPLLDDPTQAVAAAQRLALFNVGNAKLSRFNTFGWTAHESEYVITGLSEPASVQAAFLVPLAALRRLAAEGVDVIPWLSPLRPEDPFHFVIGLGKPLHLRIDFRDNGGNPRFHSGTVFGSVVFHIRFEGRIARVKQITEARFRKSSLAMMAPANVEGSSEPPIEWVHDQLSYVVQVFRPLLDQELRRHRRSAEEMGTTFEVAN